MKRTSSKMRPHRTRKYKVSILVISVLIIVLDLVFFGLTFARSSSDLDHADQRTLYSVYWLGLPVLVTGILGIIAGVRKQKALVIGYMALSIITCMLALSMAILFMLVTLYIVCGTFGENDGVGRDGKSCGFKEPIRAIYITMAIDGVLIFICCLIGSICACFHTCLCCSLTRTRDEPEVITLTPISSKPTDDPFV